MKVFGLLILFSVVGTAFLFLSFLTKGNTFSVADMASTRHGNGVTMIITSRKLKESGYTSSTDESDRGDTSLEDYHPIDPVPSSKASIKPGPIEHGTPVIPYIPKPSPPSQP